MSRLGFFVLLLVGAGSGASVGPAPMSPLRVEINIPAARLDIWLDDQRIGAYPVAVGTNDHPTPIGQFAINEITWNPWWFPPGSDWARGEKPIPPGPANPMGQVKLQFAPLYYIHGTPDSASIGYPRSHGCVRMYNADVVALAHMIVRFQPTLAPGQSNQRARTQTLADPIPLTIKYERIEADDSTVTLYPDPYRRGTPDLLNAKAVIERAGPGIVDEERLGAFLKLPATRRFIVSRSSLVISISTSSCHSRSPCAPAK